MSYFQGKFMIEWDDDNPCYAEVGDKWLNGYPFVSLLAGYFRQVDRTEEG